VTYMAPSANSGGIDGDGDSDVGGGYEPVDVGEDHDRAAIPIALSFLRRRHRSRQRAVSMSGGDHERWCRRSQVKGG